MCFAICRLHGVARPDHLELASDDGGARNPLIDQGATARLAARRGRHMRCTAVDRTQSYTFDGEPMTMKTILSLSMLFAVTVAGCALRSPGRC